MYKMINRMFNYVKNGNSLNKVIEGILGNSSNKKDNGITGYLTNGFYRKDIFESMAVMTAMQSLINYQLNYQELEENSTCSKMEHMGNDVKQVYNTNIIIWIWLFLLVLELTLRKQLNLETLKAISNKIDDKAKSE